MHDSATGVKPQCKTALLKVLIALRRLRAESADTEVDVDAQVEAFMRKQAEMESGGSLARTPEPDQVIGTEAVPDEVSRPERWSLPWGVGASCGGWETSIGL